MWGFGGFGVRVKDLGLSGVLALGLGLRRRGFSVLGGVAFAACPGLRPCTAFLDLGFRVHGLGFRVWGLGFRVVLEPTWGEKGVREILPFFKVSRRLSAVAHLSWFYLQGTTKHTQEYEGSFREP